MIIPLENFSTFSNNISYYLITSLNNDIATNDTIASFHIHKCTYLNSRLSLLYYNFSTESQCEQLSNE